MTILMETPAPAGLMWKTDWVPDWISIYTSSQQLIYHEPKPAFSHLCVSVRLLWIVTTFYLFLSSSTVCPLHLITENLGVSKMLGEMSLTVYVFGVTGVGIKAVGAPNQIYGHHPPNSYNCIRASNDLSLFAYFCLHCRLNEISWCVFVSVCHAYLWTMHMIGCNEC